MPTAWTEDAGPFPQSRGRCAALLYKQRGTPTSLEGPWDQEEGMPTLGMSPGGTDEDSSALRRPTKRQALFPAAWLNRHIGLGGGGGVTEPHRADEEPGARRGAGAGCHLGKPERTWSPSTFWLTRKRRRPTRSSCTSAMCV